MPFVTFHGQDLSLTSAEPWPRLKPADVATTLLRIPRFNGNQKEPRLGDELWTVGHHTLLCGLIAHDLHPQNPERIHTAILHDLHECIFGDIITPIKWLLTATDDPKSKAKPGVRNGGKSIASAESKVQAYFLESIGLDNVYVDDLHHPEMRDIDLFAMLIERAIFVDWTPGKNANWAPGFDLTEAQFHVLAKVIAGPLHHLRMTPANQVKNSLTHAIEEAVRYYTRTDAKA